eukprot:9740920-Alexandrium_andersonii.AAC.1
MPLAGAVGEHLAALLGRAGVTVEGRARADGLRDVASALRVGRDVVCGLRGAAVAAGRPSP